MSLIQRDAATDYANDLQFMQLCIGEGLDYEQYRQSADACAKPVHTLAQYQSMTANMLAEESYWNDMATEVGAA